MATEQLLTTRQAAAMIGIHPRTLTRWRLAGRGPKARRLAYRTVRYREQDVLAWLRQFDLTSTNREG